MANLPGLSPAIAAMGGVVFSALRLQIFQRPWSQTMQSCSRRPRTRYAALLPLMMLFAAQPSEAQLFTASPSLIDLGRQPADTPINESILLRASGTYPVYVTGQIFGPITFAGGSSFIGTSVAGAAYVGVSGRFPSSGTFASSAKFVAGGTQQLVYIKGTTVSDTTDVGVIAQNKDQCPNGAKAIHVHMDNEDNDNQNR